jgi:hypothetical protein
MANSLTLLGLWGRDIWRLLQERTFIQNIFNQKGGGTKKLSYIDQLAPVMLIFFFRYDINSENISSIHMLVKRRKVLPPHKISFKRNVISLQWYGAL